MGSLGPMEILLIFLAILLIFGAKRIPEIARGMGKGIKEFRSATRDISNELTLDDKENRIHTPRPPAQGTPAPRQDTATPERDESAAQS
ncbi:MAG: twin-arginine translocase TatA/TatE family subunit [Rhodothermales bacterium]|nr:twin-arginine translocase TatA/TatE family subunit [Rhodothermales bacterium]